MKYSSWIQAKEESKRILKELPMLRKNLFNKCKEKYPQIKYKNYSGIVLGFKHNKLESNIKEFISKDIDYINERKEEAENLSELSKNMLRDEISKDRRKKLDPKIDIIPSDIYPKLNDCTIYELRRSCNFGENENSKWDRCEYMKYDQDKSINDKDRWYCSYR